MKPYKADLAGLNQPQRLGVALACIAQVRDTMIRILHTGPCEAMDFFLSGLALAHSATDTSAISSQSARAALDGTATWMPTTGAGVWDAVMCIATILQRAGGRLTESDLYNIMSFAYQGVLYAEVLSKLDSEVTETEVQQKEASNADCMACIAGQIHLIADASSGSIVRKD